MNGAQADVLVWKKSTESGSGNCVEVAQLEHTVLVRNSKNPSGAILTFTHGEWRAFLFGVRSGEFTLG